MPASRSATASQLVDVGAGEVAWLLGLHVEDSHGLVVPDERNGQHGRDEPALVDAADPQEPGIGADIGDDEVLARGGDPAGHAFAERDAGAADLVVIEAVRGGQRQVRSVAIEQVQGGDIGVERVTGPVHDRLEQLVPGLGRGREAGDLVQEPQLGELVRARSTAPTVGLGAGVWRGWSRTGRGPAARRDWGASRPSRYKRREGRASERLRWHRDSAPERYRPRPRATAADLAA